jgi:hypothetical protein
MGKQMFMMKSKMFSRPSGEIGKPEGKRPLGRPRCRLENNIKMDLTEIEWYGCGVDSSGLG